ncbi:MAG: synthase protein [Moorella sp. (in: firmicutes)]|uniref:Putative F0F1-ATPase subunit n=1 Tax=Neomoorella thermoacetica TaxID=1525 RepID=A0A1J5NNZ1_NEOTH|nr:synthase protein [Moorella sp. (in: firmicutes)]OIQ57567.1 putative F0F1-ATPase subunit [Moorella thermoacetica]
MAFSFGITLAAGTLLGFYGGNWLDRRLGTSPWLMLAGALLGIGAGFYSIFNELRALERDIKNRTTDARNKSRRD